jgi:hypothetical protein
VADDLVPIQLSLTAGELVTLWAPAWHKDGEVWQAFLGSGDAIFVFPEMEQLVDFVHAPKDHDLVSHPRWPKMAEATLDELTPRHNHFYNITGFPNLVNRSVDAAPIAVLARIVEMVKSFADVCELGSIRETLDLAPGFDRLERGDKAFTGRKGLRAWVQMQEVVASQWKDVVATLDGVVETPDVGRANKSATEEPAS